MYFLISTWLLFKYQEWRCGQKFCNWIHSKKNLHHLVLKSNFLDCEICQKGWWASKNNNKVILKTFPDFQESRRDKNQTFPWEVWLTGLTRSLASIFCPPRNHSTSMPSYDSSHSKVAVSPAVTVTSFRGRSSPMERAEEEEGEEEEEEEEEDMVTGTSWTPWDDLMLFPVTKFVKQQRVEFLFVQSESSLSLQITHLK